jgi:hypothetical protein
MKVCYMRGNNRAVLRARAGWLLGVEGSAAWHTGRGAMTGMVAAVGRAGGRRKSKVGWNGPQGRVGSLGSWAGAVGTGRRGRNFQRKRGRKGVWAEFKERKNIGRGIRNSN